MKLISRSKRQLLNVFRCGKISVNVISMNCVFGEGRFSVKYCETLFVVESFGELSFCELACGKPS